ncbi:MAG: DUF6653 family protein [Pseudomonadota bacterium]
MKPIKAMADAMGMDEATWLRHANPWSVWSRFIILPLLAGVCYVTGRRKCRLNGRGKMEENRGLNVFF